MKTGEIKPCPFCGSSNTRAVSDPFNSARVSVFCDACGAHGPVVKSEHNAVPSWNKRAHPSNADEDYVALAKENESLRERLKTAYAVSDAYKDNYMAARRHNERQRRMWDATADHLRKARRELRETRARLDTTLEHFAVLAKDNSDLLCDLRGAELTSIIPAHYRGDGIVSAARALRSATAQPTKAERTETAFYWWALAFKYVWRLWSKGQADSDAKKAIDCLKRVIWELDDVDTQAD